MMKLHSGRPLLTSAQLNDEVLELMIKDNLPFTLLESSNFKAFLGRLTGAEVDLMCRKTANSRLEVSSLIHSLLGCGVFDCRIFDNFFYSIDIVLCSVICHLVKIVVMYVFCISFSILCKCVMFVCLCVLQTRFQQMKACIKSQLAEVEHVCVTADCWTSRHR